MSRYACIDENSVVVQVVEWDGGPQWAPPADQTAIPIPDDDFFVEPGGTLNPKTMKFVRAKPIEPDLESLATLVPLEPVPARMDALLEILAEKGTITPDDIIKIERSG